MHQVLRLNPKQFFLTVNAINQSDTSEASEKSDKVRHLKSDVPEIIISYHVFILNLEKMNLFLIKYVTVIKIMVKEGALINVFSFLT